MGNESALGSSIEVEVVSMDDKVWMEVRVIARRHGAGATRRRTGGSGDFDADDLAQDLAVAALEKGADARRPGAWLERVGRNAAIDGWRAAKRRAELALAIEPPVAPPDPEAALLGRERRRLVRRALGALPRAQRQATLARFHAELGFDEVARRIGAPVVTARTRVHRALAGLRARLGGLRAWLAWPSVHATALGLTLLVPIAPRFALLAGPETSAAHEPPAARRGARGAAGRGSPAAVPPPSPAEFPARPPAAGPAPASAAAAARTDRPAGAHPPSPPPRSSSVPEPQQLVFGNDLVEGSAIGPEGEEIRVVRPTAQPSMIELRRHFVAELMKSMEDL